MTLEQLFINIAPRYMNRTDAKRVKGDIQDIDRKVKRLGDTLNKMGVVFTAFGVAAVKAFSDTERAMSEFAGKAGVHLGRFESLFAQSSARIARQTGVQRRLIIQTQQELLSLGIKPADINKVTFDSAKLHAGNQANILASATAGAVGYKYGLGSPQQVLRTLYGASQGGAGEVPEYASVFKSVAPSASLAKMGLDTTLATLAYLGGVAPSLSEGGTWFNAFLKAMANPTDEGNALLESRTGMSFRDLNAELSQEGGLQRALNIIREAFKDDELFSVFGRQEAVKFVSATTSQENAISNLERVVRENTASMPIRSFWDHFSKTFSNSFERFKRSIDLFLEQFGEPIAWLLQKLMDLLSPLLDGIAILNQKTGGLIAWIATLVGAIAASVTAFRTLRLFLGGGLLNSIGAAVGSAVGNALSGKSPAAGGGAAKPAGGHWTGFANLAVAVVAFWKLMMENMRSFAAFFWQMFKGAMFQNLRALFGMGLASRMVGSSPMEMYAHSVIKKSRGLYSNTGSGMFDKFAKFMTKGVWNANTAKMLLLLNKIVLLLGTIATAFRWFTRDTKAAQDARKAASNASRMRQHFETGGAFDETTPLPGELDAAQIAREQADARRIAETRFFFSSLRDWYLDKAAQVWGTIYDVLTAPLPDTWSLKVDGLFADIRIGMGNIWDNIIKFIARPWHYIKLGWTKFATYMDNKEAEAFAWLSELFGFERPDRLTNMEGHLDPTSNEGTPIGTLSLTQQELKELGLEGLEFPEGYSFPEVSKRNILQIPPLPTPRIRRMEELGYSQEEIRRLWMNQRNESANVTINQNINVEGAGDPEEVARRVMTTGSSFMRKAMEDALENTESPVVR